MNTAPELIDTHCHLTSGQLAERTDAVIASAVAAGVTRMINVACAPSDWTPSLELVRRYEGRLWMTAGIHPHEAAAATDADFEKLAELWRAPGVVGCGEIGLDYHYDFSPRPVQQAVFARQLALAHACGLPIIIHSREAHDDTVRILREQGYSGAKVVFHCFSGTRAQAGELWAEGWWTSFTGTVTYKNAAEQKLACTDARADQLMFETDAPYLSPEPVRKMRPNEPANIVHTVKYAADLRGQSVEELARQSTQNALRFFGIL